MRQAFDSKVLYISTLQSMTMWHLSGSQIFSTARARVLRIFGEASNLSNNMPTSALVNQTTTSLWTMDCIGAVKYVVAARWRLGFGDKAIVTRKHGRH